MAMSIETHLAYGASRLSRIKSSATAIGSASRRDILVDVTEGPQAGSMAVVSTDNFVIGGSLSDDLFCYDPAADLGKVTVITKGSVFGPLVTVETDRPDVVMNGVAVEGASSPERLPCTLNIGKTSMTLSADGDVIQHRRRSTEMIGIFFLSVLLLSVFSFASLGPASPSRLLVAAPPPAPTPTVTTAVAARDAEGFMDSAGLSGVLSVEVVDEATISVQGTLTSAQAEQWKAIRSKVDGALGSFVVLYKVSVIPALANLPAVSIVVIGSNPFLTLYNGDRIEIGDELVPHWRISSITHDQFTIKRGEEEVAISF